MNHHSSMQRYILPLALIIGLLAAGRAQADCTITPADAINVALPPSFRGDLAPGQPISLPQTTSFAMKCDASYDGYVQVYLLTRLFPNVMEITDQLTGKDTGIGIEISLTPSGKSTQPIGAITNSTPVLIDGNIAAGVTTTYTLTYQLIKTGNLASGQIQLGSSTNMFQVYSMEKGTNKEAQAYVFLDSGSVNVIAPSCTVANSSQMMTVTLPNTSASKFKSVGATDGGQNFQIDLNCTAGSNVYITFTDGNNSGNTSQVLTTQTGAGHAAGIGLQILHNGQAISFGPDSSVPGNPGQWLVGPSAGLTSIPLTVQYVSTATVGPGAVNAAATFTLSYQ